MSVKVKLFEGKVVRFVPDNGTFLVVGNDILRALGFSKKSTAATCFSAIPQKWKSKVSIPTRGGAQKMICLREEGFYLFLNRSDKQNATLAQKWFASEMASLKKRIARDGIL